MATLEIDVSAVEAFLKKVQHGPEAVKALRYRTGVHYLNPHLDRLSDRMIEAYEKLCELVSEPFTILDAGCMAGYLRHFMQLRLKNFSYVGLDIWDEALEVAREFQPDIDVRRCDLLHDELPEMSHTPQGRAQRGFDYVWTSNINWGKHSQTIVEKLIPLSRRACFFAQPPGTGEIEKYARDLGDLQIIDCGQTTLYMVTNGYRHILRPQDFNRVVAP